MRQDAREAFLDGYRHGLGAAVRAMENVAAKLTQLGIDGDVGTITRSVLVGLIGGLRLMSASAVLAEPECSDDE